MKRRLPSMLIGGIGVVLILIPLVTNLFWVGPAFERLTDNFRPHMEAAEISRLRQDVNGLAAVQSEFTTKAVPQMAAALKMSPQEFSAALQQYPAVTAGLQSVPQVTQQFNGVLNVLDDERSRFERADAIPTSNIPAPTVPWAIAGIGVLCIAVAVFVPRRRGAITAVVLGVLVVGGVLALQFPGKADAADTMNSNLKPTYTAELVSGAKQSLAGMQAMGTELQTKLLPGLAGMLKMTPEQLQGYLSANFPAVSAGLASMPAAFERFGSLVNAFDDSLSDYDTAKETSLLPIVWMLIVAGLLVAGIGGVSLLQGQAGTVAGVKREHVGLRGRLAHATGRERLSH